MGRRRGRRTNLASGENFRKRSMAEAIEKRLNMHNEYLQLCRAAWVFFGHAALLVFGGAASQAVRPPRRFTRILFSFTVFTVSLTESILERQAGTIFICFAGLLLITAYEKERPAVSQLLTFRLFLRCSRPFGG